MLGFDPELTLNWIDPLQLQQFYIKPGQGYVNSYHISKDRYWNKLYKLELEPN